MQLASLLPVAWCICMEDRPTSSFDVSQITVGACGVMIVKAILLPLTHPPSRLDASTKTAKIGKVKFHAQWNGPFPRYVPVHHQETCDTGVRRTRQVTELPCQVSIDTECGPRPIE